MKHYLYGGSTAARTMACPGWHSQAAELPAGYNQPSDAARVGTALHECMYLHVAHGQALEKFVGQTLEGVEITAEHLNDKLLPAAERYEYLCALHDITAAFPEVTLSEEPDVGGTIDVLATGPEVTIIVDWKFGDGVLVDPQHNAQGLFYAMLVQGGAATSMGAAGLTDRVIIAIIQPTSRESENTLKTWETTSAEVSRFYGQYMDALDRADAAVATDHTTLHTGEHCRFCPAAAICPAKQGLLETVQRFPADSPTLVDLGRYLDAIPEIEQWIKAVKTMAHAVMDAGDQIPRWKLVHKRPTQKYCDEAAVEDFLKRSRRVKFVESHPAQLLSPPQLRKLFQRKDVPFDQLEPYIHKVSSGTTMAPETDSRPAVPSATALRALADRTSS